MNLFTLMGKISVDNSAANKGIDDTTQKASGASSSIGGSLSKIGTTVSNMGKTVSNAGQYVQDFSSNMLSWGKSGATGKAAIGGIAIATTTLGVGVKTAIDRMDTMRSATLTMTKGLGMSQSQAHRFVVALQNMASGTTYTTSGLAKMSAGFMAAGLSSDTTKKTVQALTDTVAGLGGGQEQIDSFAVQLQQTASVGKVATQDLNIMGASVTGLRTEMTKKFYNGDGAKFQKDLEAGNVTAQMVAETVQSMGERFKGAAKQSLGFAGTFTVIKQRVGAGIQGLLEAVGGGEGAPKILAILQNFANGISSTFAKITPVVKNFAENFGKIYPVIKPFILVISGAVGGLIALKGAAILLTPVVSALGGGIKILGTAITVMTSPIGLLVGALVLIGTAFYAFLTKTQEGRNVMVALVDVFNTSVIPVFNNVKNAISNAMNGAVGTISKSGSIINGVMQSIANFIAAHWDQISVAIGIAMDIIGAVISQGMQLWQTLIVPVITTIVSFIRDNWDNIKTIIMTVLVIVGAVIAAAMFSWQNAIFPALLAIANTVALVFNNIMGVISGVLDLIVDVINLFINIFTGNWRQAFYDLGYIMDASWKIFINIFMGALNIIVGVFQAAWALIQTGVNAFFGVVASIMTAGWNLVTSIITGLLNGISAVISGIWNGIVWVFQTSVSVITAFLQMEITGWTIIISAVLNGIKNVFVNVWNGIVIVVSTLVNAVASVITSVWNGIRNTTSAVFNGIMSVASSVWNGIRSTISGVVNGISSTVSSVWNGIRSVTSSVWNGIQNAITSPIQTAKNIIGGIINTIKSMFNFSISFPAVKIPHIPLPHFSVSGGFDLKEWSKGRGFPSLNVDWYAKGGLMTSPTMFGINGNNAMVGGEAGDEAILPLENQSVISRIAGAITDKMKPATDTEKNVEVNQYITMPATETPRDYAKRTTQEFVKVFKKA
ncbi:tape measure protein [Flyfo myovirus Tbat2_7]|nr:tape measure protein [Flyfo myovirus Tbat2_7]